MTITIACDVLGEENNGTSIAAMNLIRAMRRRGHTVRVLCADQFRKGEKDTYVVPNMSFGKLLDRIVERAGVTLPKVDRDVVREAIEGADVVHVMMPLPLGLAACREARRQNVPVTAGFHMQAENMTNYFKLGWCKPLNHLVYRFIYQHLYRYCSAIHYPTEFIRDLFESEIGVTTPGHVISNGVHPYVEKREVEKSEEFKDKYLIVSTGRYSKEKSQDTLLKAVNLSKYRDKIQVVLAGQGVLESEYRKLGDRLPNKPVYKLYGRNEVIDLINSCDMYVHPATVELEGIACLEAIACGKLTLVSDSPLSATRNFAVDPRCVFSSRDPVDLARCIDFWIENPELTARVADRYLNSSLVYSQAYCMGRMEEMFQSVVSSKKVEEILAPLPC